MEKRVLRVMMLYKVVKSLVDEINENEDFNIIFDDTLLMGKGIERVADYLGADVEEEWIDNFLKKEIACSTYRICQLEGDIDELV